MQDLADRASQEMVVPRVAETEGAEGVSKAGPDGGPPAPATGAPPPPSPVDGAAAQTGIPANGNAAEVEPVKDPLPDINDTVVEMVTANGLVSVISCQCMLSRQESSCCRPASGMILASTHGV